MRTCGGEVPKGACGATICPECLGTIIANSMLEDEDNDEFEPEDDEVEEFEDVQPGPWRPCRRPDDDDIVTSDYMKFYINGFRHKGPVVECREGESWANAVMAYMDNEKFWPNVWYIGERGDVDLIDMFEALHSEES